MIDTHHLRRVKLFKDTKTDKYTKLLLTFNDDAKKHILQYKTKYEQAKARAINLENMMNQEMQRRNRETRDGSQ